jgi:hypothetical protein
MYVPPTTLLLPQVIERNLWSLYPPDEEDDEERHLREQRVSVCVLGGGGNMVCLHWSYSLQCSACFAVIVGVTRAKC